MSYGKHFKRPARSHKGPVNANWMMHHSLEHEGLATTMKDPRAASRLLAIAGRWRNEEELATWHRLHDGLHTFIEGVIAHGS